jgi:agmatinase
MDSNDSPIGQFAYAQNSNRFLAVPEGNPDKRFCVVGVPYDGAVTNRPGARLGPQAIRSASFMLCDGEHPHFGVSPVGDVCDVGDMRLPNTSLAAARLAIEQQATALMAKHHCVFLGGDHSITLALLRAMRKQYGEALAMIHFDAHCDTWADHFGEPSGHGTWMYEAITEGLVDAKRTVQIGIRSAGARAAREYVKDQGGAIYTARALRGLVSPAQLAPVIDAIHSRIGQRPCYLTLDIDCLDPAYAPGTGTPEPGGMSSAQVLTLLEELAPLNFVGMDCNEVSPPYDHAELTSNAAATFVWTYLCSRIAQLNN